MNPRNKEQNEKVLIIFYYLITLLFFVVWFFKGKDESIAPNPTFNAPEEFKKGVMDNLEYVKNETLSVEVVFDETLTKDLTLNDYEVGIKVEKNN